MKPRLRRAGRRLALIAAVVASLPFLPAHADRTLALGGDGTWKYLALDPSAQTLFVAHGTEVTVVDVAGLRVIGHVGPISGARGVVLGSGHAGYVASGKDSTLHVFDTVTLRKIAVLPVGEDANSVTYDPVSRRIFVGNDDSGTMTVIEAGRNRIAATIKLAGGEGIESAVPDGMGNLFVNHSAGHDLVRIDTRKAAVVGRWTLQDCAKPQGLAYDPVGLRLFVSCEEGRLLTLDHASGKVVSVLPIAPGNETVLYDGRRRLIYAPGGEGRMSVISQQGADRYVPRADVATGAGARSAALDERSGRVYLVAGDMDPAPGAPPGKRAGRQRFKTGSARLIVLDTRE